MIYKIPIEKDKFEPLSNFARPNQYTSTETPSIQKSCLTIEQNNLLTEALGLIFSGGDDLIKSSITNIKKLMINNFSGVIHSEQYKRNKRNLPERFIGLIKNPLFCNYVLSLLSVFLENSVEFDNELIERGIADILYQIYQTILQKDYLDDDDIKFLGNMLSVSKKLVSRDKRFRHRLFEINFYESLPIIFDKEFIDKNGESINQMIASLISKLEEFIDSFSPNEIRILLNLIPMILKSNDPSIVRVGNSILSRLSNQTEDVKILLQDGEILQNLCSFISIDSDIFFVIETIRNLQYFATLGDNIIDMMDSFNCLQNICALFDIQNTNLIDCVFDLTINWLIHPNNSLQSILMFLKNINFIFIFENSDYNIKNKAIRILHIAALKDISTNQILEIVNFDLFKIIISQFSFSDDSDFSYHGCCLIVAMLNKLSGPQFKDQVKSCFLNDDDFYNKLEYIKFNEEIDIANKADEIFFILQKIMNVA